jgi:hypothetical protein
MTQTNDASAAAVEKAEITLVAPNGAQFDERYHANQKVSHVLDVAVREFGKKGDLDPSKSYVLVREQTVLEPASTLADAGVEPGDLLKVRARQIPGDG